MQGTTTTTDPVELRLVTEWPSGGQRHIYVMNGDDVHANVKAGETADGPRGVTRTLRRWSLYAWK
jgi:hypothetical protein